MLTLNKRKTALFILLTIGVALFATFQMSRVMIIVSENGVNIDMTEHTACCSNEITTFNHVFMSGVEVPGTASVVFGIIFTIIASLCSLLLYSHNKQLLSRLDLYQRFTRLHYGSFRCFIPFTNLFKIGLLHPKTW